MTEDFNFNYPITLTKQREGGYLVQFLDFPEAITQGDDEEEALREAADCLEEAIANRMVMGLDIPPRTHYKKHLHLVSLPLTLAAKCALYIAMKRNNYKNVSLARNLQCNEKEVRRLLDPRYKSKIARIEEALNFLGKNLTLSVTNREHFDTSPIDLPLRKPPKADLHHSTRS